MNHHNPACFAHHMGLYMIDHRWAANAKLMITMCPAETMAAYKPREAYEQMLQAEPVTDMRRASDGTPLYGVTADGIAVIPVIGVMTKGSSKFGTSTQDVRRSLREAGNDSKINGIMLHFDTPGGSFAGTEELANEIARVNQLKPVHAHADDLIASAGMYAASQVRRLSINATGEAGSIGTYAVIEDTSGMAEMMGVKVHLLATGNMKGAGAPGVALTDPQIARFQQSVEQAQTFFSDAMVRGRGLSKAQVNDLVADGFVYFGKEAKAKGLVDAVESYEAAMDKLVSVAAPRRRNALARQIRVFEAT
jgi:protease-4